MLYQLVMLYTVMYEWWIGWLDDEAGWMCWEAFIVCYKVPLQEPKRVSHQPC